MCRKVLVSWTCKCGHSKWIVHKEHWCKFANRNGRACPLNECTPLKKATKLASDCSTDCCRKDRRVGYYGHLETCLGPLSRGNGFNNQDRLDQGKAPVEPQELLLPRGVTQDTMDKLRRYAEAWRNSETFRNDQRLWREWCDRNAIARAADTPQPQPPRPGQLQPSGTWLGATPTAGSSNRPPSNINTPGSTRSTRPQLPTELQETLTPVHDELNVLTPIAQQAFLLDVRELRAIEQSLVNLERTINGTQGLEILDDDPQRAGFLIFRRYNNCLRLENQLDTLYTRLQSQRETPGAPAYDYVRLIRNVYTALQFYTNATSHLDGWLQHRPSDMRAWFQYYGNLARQHQQAQQQSAQSGQYSQATRQSRRSDSNPYGVTPGYGQP